MRCDLSIDLFRDLKSDKPLPEAFFVLGIDLAEAAVQHIVFKGSIVRINKTQAFFP